MREAVDSLGLRVLGYRCRVAFRIQTSTSSFMRKRVSMLEPCHIVTQTDTSMDGYRQVSEDSDH